ncbi:MAG: AsmA family protein [Alphaproteobacteria bacterium]|nr:AsmA family protein [Alphaproteobacteria bacterium]
MLKKIIIGILCFIIIAVTGLGIYIYTLDWNKQKAVVAQRFSQITGLKATIEGNLTVDLFPVPKFSAGMVKFSKNNARTPLVEINDISANVELMPLLDNKFILSSMSLTGATIHLGVSEKGELNWSGVRSGGKNKSGNIEVSFNDVRMSESVISYENKKTGDKFEIPGVSANIKANSLAGPYKTDGKFIHNRKEVNFNGDVVINDDIVVKMTVNNASTASKLVVDGSFGKKAKGNISFDSKSLYDVVSVIFGENKISEVYDSSLFVSFMYDYAKKQVKLDNFTTKYGNNTAGSGIVNIKKAEKWDIDADLNMLQFDLGLLEDISKDIIQSSTKESKEENASSNEKGKPQKETTPKEKSLPNYNLRLNIKSNYAKYKNVDAQKLVMGLGYSDGILSVDRFSVVMPGESVVNAVGRVSFAPKIEYIFNQTIDSQDIRIFASVFGLDLAKNTPPADRKSVFKRTQAELMISGDLNSLKVSAPKAQIDSTSLSGNVGFIFGEDKNFVLVQADVSKIMFDKYFQAVPNNLKNASLEEKLVYQLNLAPWKGNFETDATINIGNAVYNKVAIENIDLHFVADSNRLDIKKFATSSLAGAQVNITANIDNPYTKPYFNELSYDIKTNNFPILASSLGIDTGSKGLFKRKLFAAQGALSGRISEFSVSSVQKFGDVEFLYSGSLSSNKTKNTFLNGNIELKTNNFSNFVKAIGFDYKPDIPVTNFTLSSQINGDKNLFELAEINAYLGASGIKGNIKVDNTQKRTDLKMNLTFDKFDANRMFNIAKTENAKNSNDIVSFILNPKFNGEKFDFALLNKTNFEIDANIAQLLWNNGLYTNFASKMTLNNGILNIASLEAQKDESKINLDFVLNSNGIAKIEGNFDVENYRVPSLGGNVYRMENGMISANGRFSSIVSSEKDFFENLNSKGRFWVRSPVMNGWDLDIIKFELEQRKAIEGFDETVISSLKSGKSSFDEVKGQYEIKNGIIVSDNIIWSSPVVNMNMVLDANLSNWKFNSDVNAFYKNASFSDVLKFSFGGDLSNPDVKVDLSESIARINEVEKLIVQAEKNKEKEKTLLLKGKIDTLQNDIKVALQDINRMSFDVVRFKPITQNSNVKKVYDTNIKELKVIENKLKELKQEISNASDEKVLMDLEAKLAKEISRFKYIPKTLEENYVVDSKYLFDDTFNKISWLFNLAQNNSSYYNSLTEIYMTQIDILSNTETPVSKEKVEQIDTDMKNIAKEVDRISKLHAKIRDNYLNIIDSTSVSAMKENNELAEQALNTMHAYVIQLNSSLINSMDVFRGALGINARDYDLYMVHPPRNVEDIDISKPTTNVTGKEKVVASKADETSKEDSKDLSQSKKKDKLTSSFEEFGKSISSLVSSFTAQKNSSKISDLEFSGLSKALSLKPTILENKEDNKDAIKVASLTTSNDKDTSKDAKEEAIETKNQANENASLKASNDKEDNGKKQIIAETNVDLLKDKVELNESLDEKLKIANSNIENIMTAQKKMNAEMKKNADAIKNLKNSMEFAELQNISTSIENLTENLKQHVKTEKNELVNNNEKAVDDKNIAIAKLDIEESLPVKNLKSKETDSIKSGDDNKSKVSKEINQNSQPILATTLFNKTKNAISNLMSKITEPTKSKVENLKDLPTNNQKEETIAKDNEIIAIEENKEDTEIIIAEENITNELEQTPSSLKINPVIALNIGKTDTAMAEEHIALAIQKKKGFKTQNTKTEVPNKTYLTSKTNRAPLDKESIEGIFIATNDNITNDGVDDTSFAVLSFEEENDNITQIEKKYIIANNNVKKEFRGDLGKTALRNDNIVQDNIKESNYLFFTTQPNKPTLAGKIGKKFALSVK